MIAATSTLVWFGRDHAGGLLATVVLAVLLSFVWRSTTTPFARRRLRRVTCWGLAALLILNDVVISICDIRASTYTLKDSLPLHLCDFSAYVTIILLALVGSGTLRPRWLRVRQFVFELAYFWVIAGTTQALLTPEISDVFPSRGYLHYFVMHGGVWAAVCGLTLGLRLRPLPGAVWRVSLATALLAAPVALVDWLIGANYMYLCGPPLRPSLYDYLGPWPWSLAGLGVAGLVTFSLCYSPFWWHDRRVRRPVLPPHSRHSQSEPQAPARG